MISTAGASDDHPGGGLVHHHSAGRGHHAAHEVPRAQTGTWQVGGQAGLQKTLMTFKEMIYFGVFICLFFLFLIAGYIL